MASAGGPKEAPFLAGLFFVTAATLAVEVLITRLLSVITWYSLAFLVLAMGMFGMTAGAVRVYLRSDDYTEGKLASSLARDALWFAALVPIAYALLLVVPLRTDTTATTVVLFVVFSAIVALPFVAAGQIVAAALTRSPFPTGRVYAVDLAGAALGAPLVPELLERMDCGTAMIAMGVLGAIGACAFAAAADDEQASRRGLQLAGGLAILGVLNASSSNGLVPLWSKGRPEDRAHIAYEAWNSHSRVQVSDEQIVTPALWGGGSKCRLPKVRERMIVIDADAATPLYHPEKSLDELGFLDCDVTNVVHFIRSDGAMAIIGVGGSRDIQAALIAGHAPVLGIELNRRLLEILRGPMGQPTLVPNDRRVQLVNDEARSYLARTKRKFKVIQASLIDTWASTGAGAHALSENGIYTLEAWRTFLDRLEPGGVVTMSRWSSIETIRLVALATAALLDRGAQDPRQHIAVITAGPVTTAIVGRDPLTDEDTKKLEEVADEKGFTVLLAPGIRDRASKLDAILDAKSRAAIDAATLLPDLDFRPPTDDRPFFFHVVRLGAMFTPMPATATGTIEGNRLATVTLGLALFASIVLASIAIVAPLAHRAKPRGRVSPALTASLVYFALIGVGFMLCEVGLLQRLSIVLGHPTYSLIVVLASLVAAAGLGSLVSDRLPLDRAPWCFVYPLVLAGGVAFLAFGVPALAPKLMPAPLPRRIGACVALTGGVGLLLGVAFPAGMRIVRATHHEETPWLWGVNGVGGVVASSLAIVLAHVVGLRFLFVVAACCYVLLVPAIAVLRKPSTDVA